LNKSLEVGAEIFAAELLFPDRDFVAHMNMMGIRRDQCLPKTLIRLKRKTGTTLSYAGLAIKAERLGFAPSHSLTTIKTWRRLEELYSAPAPSRRSRTSRHICHICHLSFVILFGSRRSSMTNDKWQMIYDQ
jgi:hypothetical protein